MLGKDKEDMADEVIDWIQKFNSSGSAQAAVNQ